MLRRLAHSTALTAALASAGTAAVAAQWSAAGSVSQGFTVGNEFGDDAASSVVGRSSTSVGISLSARTQTTRWNLSTGATLNLATDDYDDVFGDTVDQLILPRISGSVTHSQPRYSLFARLSADPQFVSSRRFDSLFPDPEDPVAPEEGFTRTDVDALEILIRGSVGASFQLDQRNSLTATTSVRVREYSDTTDELQPSQRVGVGLSWGHALDPRTSLSLGGDVAYFTSDRADRDDTVSGGVTAGASRRLTPRHTLGLSLGVSASDDGDDLRVSPTGAANLSYSGVDYSYSIGFRQSVDQNDAGSVEARSALSAGASYRINSVSSAGIGASLAFGNPLFGDDGDRVGFSIGPRYSLALAESWSLTLGYGFSIDRDNNGDVSGSNRVFLRLGRPFEIFR